MPQRILDACCLINLFSAGNTTDILRSLVGGVFVPDIVIGESLYIRRPDPADEAAIAAEAIDLSAPLSEGLLEECRLEDEAEFREFVRFAAVLDDGEAACLALARCRGWVVATDDRKAIRVAGADRIAVVTTPELVKEWADGCGASDEAVGRAIRNIERFARFAPRQGAPLWEWWERPR